MKPHYFNNFTELWYEMGLFALGSVVFLRGFLCQRCRMKRTNHNCCRRAYFFFCSGLGFDVSCARLSLGHCYFAASMLTSLRGRCRRCDGNFVRSGVHMM